MYETEISGALIITIIKWAEPICELSVMGSLSDPTGALGEELELVALQWYKFPSALKCDYGSGSFVLFELACVS